MAVDRRHGSLEPELQHDFELHRREISLVGDQLGLESETVVYRIEGDAEVTTQGDSGYTSNGASRRKQPGHAGVAGLSLSGGEMIQGKLSLVLPAYNEVENISEVVATCVGGIA